jgi:hypothetical protein
LTPEHMLRKPVLYSLHRQVHLVLL